MRWIDIDDLQLPDNWQTRADRALNALRAEVAHAEAAAVAAGRDGVEARRTAIVKGLNVSAREALWRELKKGLGELSDRKCWYSESRNPTADKEVDHFRPKASVDGDGTHDGYWWLAFTWRNYRYSSQWCNQRRVGDVNEMSGGKGDRFPLLRGSFRARTESDELWRENVALIDPVHPEDWTLLTFIPNGYPTPSRAEGTPEHTRAAISIEVYHLNCRELVDGRRPLAGRVQRLVENMERLLPDIGSNYRSRDVYTEQQRELFRLIRKTAEYSAAALAYARGEVYILRQGAQIKRQWLENILNANP